MADNSLPEGDALRLTRDLGDRGPSLAERLSERLDRLSFASPWHRMRLQGRFPLKLLAVPTDPIPGDPETGARLKAGKLEYAGYGARMDNGRLDDPAAPVFWHDQVHGWGWLRDAAAAGPSTRTESTRIEGLARRWLARFHNYDEIAWAPARTGRRIMMAITYAPLVMPGHDHIHRSAVLNGIARWARHLDRAAPRVPPGTDRAEAAAGLLAAALLLPSGDERRVRAEALLADTLGRIVHQDGSVVTRSPLELAQGGDLLLFLSAFYKARAQRPPAWMDETRRHMRNALTGLAMGDGLPGPWHGGQPTLAMMERLGATPVSADARPGRDSGYQRLAAGQTILVMDAGPPPPARLSDTAHASTLAIMMSDGKQPLIVSCGSGTAAEPLPSELQLGLRSTAGHSTLVLADSNSSRLADGGPRKLGGVQEVLVETRASGDGQWLEAQHDGYRKRFGVQHLRRLYLSPDGQDLRGEDVLLPASHGLTRLGRTDALDVVVRFHLGPGCSATGTQDGSGALISLPVSKNGRTAEKSAWAFRASFNSAPGRISIEPSILIDANGQAQDIQQIVLATKAGPGVQASIGWSFRRQGK
ncbi:MAG: heparinase II/III family protein [Sphingomonadaceae bacterium]